MAVWVDCFGTNYLLPDTSEGLLVGLEESPDLANVQKTCSRYAAPLEESRSVNIYWLSSQTQINDEREKQDLNSFFNLSFSVLGVLFVWTRCIPGILGSLGDQIKMVIAKNPSLHRFGQFQNSVQSNSSHLRGNSMSNHVSLILIHHVFIEVRFLCKGTL